ncbi:hypothetical protein C2G38_2231766 [Gigaspora rosea]|uniref:Uncharacterized protein n=1 Tax=Gigaspora rosea TaxID=44941 RepID=A0A397TW73_9GLOM|nr:hypothetical protein C2G38_2231766 [Gigaspora rosea]
MIFGSNLHYPMREFKPIPNSTLQEVNSMRQKYGRAQGLMRKALNLAIATNSYNKLMGICHEFILDKQESDSEMNDIEYDIMNSIITTRRG